MQVSERNDRFVSSVLEHPAVGSNWHKATMYGFSNGARFIDGGLLLGVANLEKFSGIAGGMVMFSVINASPEDHIYFAVLVNADGVRKISQRLTKPSADDSIETGKRGKINNNVRMHLLGNGKVFVDPKVFHSTVREADGFNPAMAEPLVEVERIIYAHYPPTSTAHRTLMAGQFVGYLAEMVGRDKVEEINPWGTEETPLSPLMRRSPVEIPLAEIQQGIGRLGGYYIDDLVERYHIGLNHLPGKHFVILAGLSGTGKTGLARKYAQAVHGIIQPAADDPLMFICPVRPDWTDPTGLLGYYDVISNRYVVPRFLDSVITALTHRDSPVFVCVDEMNNARVEYYFADVLSAMESGMPLHLHSHSTPLPGTTGGEIPSEVPLPQNLYIIGTINVDETTQTISDKVLDRAVVIDMSAVDIDGFLKNLATKFPELRESVVQCGGILHTLAEILSAESLGFGYRVAEEFVRYFAAGQKLGSQVPEASIDDQIAQKILVKLRGGERQRRMLAMLGDALAPFPKSRGITRRMLEDLDEFGSFQALR